MKNFIVIVFIFMVISCNKKVEENIEPVNEIKIDTLSVKERPKITTYSNDRFKDVVVYYKDGEYHVKGKAQVFEASFSWVVEDGHNELSEGHEMTDAGAPEFGNLHFMFKVDNPDPNTTLHLILFESSPKDGSRQHELAIPLPAASELSNL